MTCTYEEFLTCIESKTHKEYGVLFKPPLVRAIANTTINHQPVNPELPIKWQTRRIIKLSKNAPSPIELEPWIINGEQEVDESGRPCWIGTHPDYPTGKKWISPPYGVGDYLWIKEKAKVLEYSDTNRKVKLRYEADGAEVWLDYPERLTWIPKAGSYFPRGSLFREAARMSREITQVRVQKLQEISAEDAIAEGVSSVEEFKTLWASINKEPSERWNDNPWVWVYDFNPLS